MIVGVSDGAVVGSDEGTVVGIDEGKEDGAYDGTAVGASVGTLHFVEAFLELSISHKVRIAAESHFNSMTPFKAPVAARNDHNEDVDETMAQRGARSEGVSRFEMMVKTRLRQKIEASIGSEFDEVAAGKGIGGALLSFVKKGVQTGAAISDVENVMKAKRLSGI